MMLEHYYRINQVAGISIHLLPDGTASISCCRISGKGSQLHIDQKLPDIRSLEELVQHLPAKTPVALNLSGKGVLYKQTEGPDPIGRHNFSELLPNANSDDFYIQNFGSGASLFVSLIRRSEADKWISRLRETGFIPLSLSLGPFPVEQIIPQLNSYKDELKFDGHLIRRDAEGRWLSYHTDASALAPFAMKVGSEGINEKLLIPYASAFQLVLADRLELIQAGVPELESAFRGRLRGQQLKINSAIFLSVFFIALLANFIFFSLLSSANNGLASRVSRLVQTSTDAHGLDEQLSQKERLLQSLGWDGGINKSALVDQLARLMPEEITLSELAVNPVDLNGSRAQRAIVFFNRRIRIIGTCARIIPVNEWIARIKTRPWVKEVQLESYAYNNEFNTGQFSLTLNY